MRRFRSTHLLMFLPLEILTSIIRTRKPLLVELLDLVSSFIIFLSQLTLLRWLFFVLGYLTVNFTVMLFWIYVFLLVLVFVLQWLSLHWKILIMSSRFPLTFVKLERECPILSHSLWLFSCWLGQTLRSCETCFIGEHL